MSADLRGEVAVVTGALGNLGPLWIEALAGAGMRVAAVDVREGDSHADLFETASVTDVDALRRVQERVERELGHPILLVNNAGIDQPPDRAGAKDGISAISGDEFLRVLDVNTRGTFVASQVFGIPMQRAGGGSIVNIGSPYASISPHPAF